MSEKSDATVEMAETAEAKSLNPNDIDVKSDVKKKKPSLKYFLELLSDSVVTGIPQIVTVGNLVRKVFKILVLTACLAGFIYQAVEFMNIYNTYPSSLEIEVKYRDELPAPFVTICNRNPVQRRQFCKEKTEVCAKPTNLTRFCNMYPHHCNENTTVNDLEFVISNAYIAVEDLEIYGQNADDLLAECCYTFFALAEECRKNSVNFVYYDENNMMRRCYTINFDKVIKLDRGPTGSFKEWYEEGAERCLWWSPMALEDTYSVMVNLDPEEVFRPEMKPSAQVLVHSSNDLKNPFQKGFTIEEGKQYTVTMRAIEEELLPAPYSTNCTKNEEMPEDYDRQGCIDECNIKLFAERCGCVPISLIATDIPTCPEEEIGDCISSVGDGETCFLQCPRLCHSFYFEYEVTSSDFPDSVKPIDLGDGPVYKDSLDKNVTDGIKQWIKLDKKGKAFLKVVYSKKEMTIYKYKPKYESVEILGYIGGFSGIWLGVSLVAVFDFFETIIVFICYLIKRAKTKKNYSGS